MSFLHTYDLRAFVQIHVFKSKQEFLPQRLRQATRIPGLTQAADSEHAAERAVVIVWRAPAVACDLSSHDIIAEGHKRVLDIACAAPHFVQHV